MISGGEAKLEGMVEKTRHLFAFSTMPPMTGFPATP